MIRRGLALASCTFAFAAEPARAQTVDTAASHRGELVMRADAQLGLVVRSEVQRRAAFAAADRVVAILKADKALSAPLGYATVVHRVAGLTGAGGDELAPGLAFHYGVKGGLNYYAMEDDGRGGRRVGDGGGSVPFSVVVNGVGRITDDEQLTLALDHGPPVLQDYRKTGVFRGHPVYNGECVFITRRPGAMPFVPLTKARYYTLQVLAARADSVRHHAQHQQDNGHNTSDALAQWIRDRPKREAEMQATYNTVKSLDPKSAQQFLDSWKSSETDAEARLRAGVASGADQKLKEIEAQAEAGEGARIASIQATLDALSPAQRAAPAALDQGGPDGKLATDASDSSSAPLVQLNPSYYDKTLPPDAPQIVTVCLPGLQASSEIARFENMSTDRGEWSDQRERDTALIRDQLDWAALEAMVRP